MPKYLPRTQSAPKAEFEARRTLDVANWGVLARRPERRPPRAQRHRAGRATRRRPRLASPGRAPGPEPTAQLDSRAMALVLRPRRALSRSPPRQSPTLAEPSTSPAGASWLAAPSDGPHAQRHRAGRATRRRPRLASPGRAPDWSQTLGSTPALWAWRSGRAAPSAGRRLAARARALPESIARPAGGIDINWILTYICADFGYRLRCLLDSRPVRARLSFGPQERRGEE
jgi:hypothetical protein